jgi:iron(III) transport system substrate-binding protein
MRALPSTHAQGNERPLTRSRTTARRRGRAAALLVAAGLLTAPLAAAGSASASTRAHASQVTLVLYNGQHQQTTDSVVAGFEAAYPNIKVNVRDDDEDTFDDEIVQEGSRSPADVFYTENSPALEYLQQRGLLAKVDASTLAQIPSKYSSPQGDWVGVSARVSVLIYNPSLIKKADLPTQVLQLANPKYKGLLAFAAGETDFQPIVTAVDKAYGKTATLKWLNGIKANAGSHVYPDNETIADEVNRGQVAFGVVNQYYWYRMRAEVGASNMHSEIAYFAPGNPGYVVDVSGAAVLKSSKHQVAAQEFLAYLTSKAGQEVIANSGYGASQAVSFEYPIAAGVTTKAPETPFSKLQPYPITIAQLGTGETAISLLREEQLL